jgi:polyphosphate glucokinase
MQVLGIDIGGSGIKGAPVDTDKGELLAERQRIATPKPSEPMAVAEVIAKLVAFFNWSGPVGCTFPAVIKEGVAYTAANVDKRWIGTDAAGLIREQTGRPTAVLNDADAAGLAEMQFGAGREENGVVIMLTFGTGIGTAIFADRRLLPNTELGHMDVKGREGEAFASDAARKRDDLSWEEWAQRANEYFQALDALFWPDLFIVGGGISNKPDKWLPFIQTTARVAVAQMRNEAGMIGAALAARRMAEGLPPTCLIGK